jgi:hypothetical protein
MAGWSLLRAVRDRLSAMVAPSWRLVPPLATGGLALLLAALLIKEVPMLDRSVRSVILPPDRPRELDIGRAWQANRARLLPLAQGAQVFVADDDLQAAFHVARADFFLNRSQLLENQPPVEFVRDFRTGTPLVSSPESLLAIIACFDRGLLVSSSIGMSWLTPEARQVIATRTRPLDLVPPLIGGEWNHEGRQGDPGPECARLREMAAATARQRAAR